MAIGKLSSSPPPDSGQQEGRSDPFTAHGALSDWWERERERERGESYTDTGQVRICFCKNQQWLRSKVACVCVCYRADLGNTGKHPEPKSIFDFEPGKGAEEDRSRVRDSCH